MHEPPLLPFLWTCAAALLSFLVGEALGRIALPLWFALLWGVVFSLLLAGVRMLLHGLWSIP